MRTPICTVVKRISCLALAAMTVAHAAPARAQAVYGSVAGVVVDNSGAVLPGVTVTVTSLERQTVDSVVSNESGFYVKDRLLPGLYEVKAELSGFKTALVPKVDVRVDTQVPINLTLEVGEITEQVTVTGTTPLLRTDRADVATTFESRELTELPVLDRNFTKFVLLTPGAQRLGWSHAASENPQGSTQTQVNGQHFSGTGYQLDGTENRDVILGIIVINPTLESIRETKITSQNYDAEFGQATAGVVSVQTKSGTNEMHGSAFEFFQNESLQARNPFSQAQPDPITGKFIPDTKRNQFGGSFGGPIVANKWFFFGDYQGTRQDQGGSRLLTVPTAAARTGDLSAYGVRIFDPATGQEFANGQIPASRLSPQSLRLLQLMPLPNAPGTENGTRNNYVASGIENFEENSFNTRVDGRLGAAINSFARFSLGDFSRNGPTAFGDAGGREIVSLGGVSKSRNMSLASGVDYAISSNWLADFRVGWFRYKVDVLPFDYGTTPAADAGIPGLNVDEAFTSGLPLFRIEGNRGFGMGSGLDDTLGNRCNCPLQQNEKQFQVVGNLTRLWGNHQLKAGIDVRRAWNIRVPSDRHRSGELTFNELGTGSPTLGGGLGIATFLLGNVTRFSRYVSPTTEASEQQWRHFYYAQDTWRVNNKLTLNYGLRLDVINPQTVNEAGNGGWVDLATGQMLVGGVGDVNLAGNVENRLNWAPRVGATYQLTERTVLRTGFGRSYDIGVFGSLFGHTVTQNLPVLSAQELNPPSDFASVFNLAQGPPAPTFVQPDQSGRFVIPNGVFSRALPRKQRPPEVDAWNVSVQHQLRESMSVEAAYVGNHGRHVFVGDGPDIDANTPTVSGFAAGVPRDLRRPFFAGLVTPPNTGQSGPYGWTQRISIYYNQGQNWYNALQLRFNKRFAEGYAIQSNYTWQKAENEANDYWIWDRDLEKGPADWDRTHTLNLTLIAQVPVGKDQRFGSNWSGPVDAVLGGWQFNTNVTIQSGLPFTPSYADCGLDRDVGPCRPNLTGDADGPQTRDQWFNAAPIGASGSAFGRPAVGTFGDIGRNSLRGPGYWRADASLFKSIPLGGVRRIELRLEAVNIFNHVNLANPDAEIGVPGNARPNAGRITSTAYGGQDPQRNFQFGLKFAF